ncbi:unnamed protein product [Diamesa hyperborea]
MGLETKEPSKPRRTRGTYSYKFRNYFASAILGVAIISGIAWTCLPFVQTIRAKAKRDFFSSTDDEKDRRYLMSLFTQKNAIDIDKLMKEDAKITAER